MVESWSLSGGAQVAGELSGHPRKESWGDESDYNDHEYVHKADGGETLTEQLAPESR
jgi:hypothetical protein